MARKLCCGWLILGTILMAGVVAIVVRGWPLRLDESAGPLIVSVVLGAWTLGYVIAARLVIMDALRLFRNRDLDGLQRSANLIKLIAIPFFLANYVALLLLTGSAASWFGELDRPETGPGGIAVALGFVLWTYLVFLPTSAYGVACLRLMREDGKIGKGFFGVNLVLHLLFVVDVLSGILVVEFARHVLGRVRAPSAVGRHLISAVVLLPAVGTWLWLGLGLAGLAPIGEGGFLESMAVLILGSLAEFVLLVAVPVVPLITFRTAVRHYLRGDLDELRRAAGLVKLLAIPMFIQNFVACVLVVLAATLFPVIASRGIILMVFPILGVFTSATIAVLVVGTFLMMLTTSIYGVASLALMLRQRAIGPAFFAVNLILHLIFITDIVSTLVVAGKAGSVLEARQRNLISRPR